jgi:hypothetical protein
LLKKFVSLGTECVEFLKAARASQGKLFATLCLLSILFVFPWLFIQLSFPFLCDADTLSAANARILSLEAKLEASKKAWDVAAAAKTAAEKSTKSAVAKAKKAEKALADADRERAQREQAIAKRLTRFWLLLVVSTMLLSFWPTCSFFYLLMLAHLSFISVFLLP